jgi:GT2 family glycosyltransferase
MDVQMVFRGEDEIQRLLDENRDLKAQLRAQVKIFADLEARLLRIETSVIFRFLRWLGPRLARAGVPWFTGLPASGPKSVRDAAAKAEYAKSARDVILLRRAFAKLRADAGEIAGDPLVSIVITVSVPDRPTLDRLLQSIEHQEHSEWELLIATGESPGWLAESLAQRAAGHRTELILKDDAGDALRLALGKCRGEYAAVIGEAALLEPDALHHFLKAAGGDAAAVYSDWDSVNAAGDFHSPRFTPELSPELLRSTPYWGDCFLLRTTALRRIDWSGEEPALHALHDLSIRVANTLQPVRRVPQVLWHAQSEFADPAPVSGPGRRAGTGSVSVILCSRSPEQLRHCLNSLTPTLDRRHEVIVVAHGRSGQGAVLAQTAEDCGARPVCYDGPFHFGLMNHIGIAESRGEILCLLNDDVEPITPDWLERMHAQAGRAEIGMVGALLLYPNRTIQHAGAVVGDGFLPTHLGYGFDDSPYWPWLKMTREVTVVTAACLALRRTVWEELGGFDMRFPGSYNDVDLCLRARERGYRVLLEAGAVLVHHESRTRNPVVLPEESNLFRSLWSHVVLGPEPYFNPHLELLGGDICMRKSPASIVQRAGIGEEALPAYRETALKRGAK